MPDTSSIQNLFSSLTPLHRREPSATGTAESAAHFTLSIDGGEPLLEVADFSIPTHEYKPQEMQLYNEVCRIIDSYENFFESDSKSSGEDWVSLWEYPYLINLITPECRIEGPENGRLTFPEEEGFITLNITTSVENPTAELNLHLTAGEIESDSFIFLDETHVMAEDKVVRVKSVGRNYRSIREMIGNVEKPVLETFLTLFLSYVENVTPLMNGMAATHSSLPELAVATLFLEKVAPDKALYLRTGSSIESLGSELPPGTTPTVTAHLDEKNGMTIRTVEDCNVEEATDKLEGMILRNAPDRNARKNVYREGNFFIIPEETAGPFLLNCLPEVLEIFRLVGSEKLKEYKVVAAAPKVNFKFSSGIDFLEGEGDVTIGNDIFSIGDILKQYASKRYVQLSDGNRGILDENYIARLQRLFRRRDKEGRIRVTIFDMPEVEELMQAKLTGPFAAKQRGVLEGFNTLKESVAPRYAVDATLRPYQIEGVKWMRYLYDNDLGGCLADDMGLGKTLQTIALLTMIYPQEKRPSLIVMPRSLLFNWGKELERFAPQLTFHTYYGNDRNLEEALKHDLVLTTYTIARNDIEELRKHRFECIVLDESQHIKNLAAQTTASVFLLEGNHRFALSGTPMENNLTELYSLFRFLNPTMFGSIEDFNASYALPIQKYGDKGASDSLRRKIFPFIMRRLKKDVLQDLPERIDQTIYIEMSERQKRMYEERRLSYKKQINEHIAREGIHKSQFMMLQALSELRRIASVPESISDGVVASPKIEELVDALVSSVANGHKSVVFFNFLAGVEIVMSRLEKAGIRFESMTGSTSTTARKKIVEHFQSDPECKVILLTLKVGGVGLNLTAADTVFIFEPWWNKAAEEQAINRLHRIGQKKTVTSYSLITLNTIEEKMLQLQAQKSELFNELISADTTTAKTLTQQDIDFILS